MRIVVCDTGPLLHLSEADASYLLHQAGEIIVPPIVAKEFEKNALGREIPEWVRVQELEEPYSKKALGWAKHIDEGESAAIALSLQTKADWLLSDDAKARQFAETLGLEVHGSIGLLLWNVAQGYIADQKDATNLLNALSGTSLWISDRVLRKARQAIDALFVGK